MKFMSVINNKKIYVKPYDTLYKEYRKFIKNLGTESPNPSRIKTEFIQLEDKFVREHQTKAFCDNSNNFIDKLIKDGKDKLANIFLNELGKLHLRKGDYATAEKYIMDSLDLSIKFNDNIHALARLNDLEIIYKATGDRKNLLRVLHDKKTCIKEIIRNYEENVKNYQSIIRPATSKESILIQLAYTYSDISDLLLRNRPQDSLKATMKARDIYERLGKAKETKYLNVKIEKIAQRLQQNKHLDPKI